MSAPVSERACRLCGAGGQQVAYEGPIRAGSFGKMTAAPHRVLRCGSCGVAYLESGPAVDYDSGAYRLAYNDSVDVEAYFAAHDRLQPRHLLLFGSTPFRGRVVADFGCGGGSFLDHVSGLASRTLAVEPCREFHESLTRRGHRVYASGGQLLAEAGSPVVEVATSIHVLEHVSDPVAHLAEIRAALADDGVLYVATPNLGDLLLLIAPAVYAPFFYRTAHQWYFDARSLAWVARQAGFGAVKTGFHHGYDLSNAFCWARDGRPTGNRHLPVFDGQIDAAWKGFLEDKGGAEVVWAECRLPRGA